jgi:5'-AMP-activated protein kinase catalytic alpha subunit
MNEDLCKQIFK